MANLFEQSFLTKLERMAFLFKKARAGRYSGAHRSPRKGHSVEFADYRSYVSGDDWRQVDWKAYARLERLFVKLFVEEQDILIHLLLDTSGSMAWQGGEKLQRAKEILGALGYLALVNLEQVSIAALNQEKLDFLPVQRGRSSVNRVWSFLQNLEGKGETDLNRSLKEARRVIKRPGVSIVVSDFLSPLGYQEGLRYLQHLGQQIVVLQLLTQEERQPTVMGNFRLVDSETGGIKEVTITPMLLQAYQQQVDAFVDDLRRFCLARNITYIYVGTEEALEDILLRSLRSGGVLA